MYSNFGFRVRREIHNIIEQKKSCNIPTLINKEIVIGDIYWRIIEK
jgi:hypothetical protein